MGPFTSTSTFPSSAATALPLPAPCWRTSAWRRRRASTSMPRAVALFCACATPAARRTWRWRRGASRAGRASAGARAFSAPSTRARAVAELFALPAGPRVGGALVKEPLALAFGAGGADFDGITQLRLGRVLHGCFGHEGGKSLQRAGAPAARLDALGGIGSLTGEARGGEQQESQQCALRRRSH